MNLLDTIYERARATLAVSKSGDYPIERLHPDLYQRVPILRVTSDEHPQETQSDYQKHASYYGCQTWVHRAVKVVSDNACPLPRRVVKGDARESEPLPTHEITELLANPNPETSPADLWRAVLTDMMLAGEHGLEVTKAGSRYKELWNRQPPDFSVKPGVLGRRYKRIAYYRIDDGEGDPYPVPPEEFIHPKFYNPLNVWRGLAPIAAIRNSILIDQLAQVWSRLFFKNSARPDYAVIAPEGLTKTEREEMELKLWQEHGGGNAHRPIILEAGVSDIKTFSFPPKDMEWLSQREYSRDEIAAIFGVPDEIMGYGKNTYENFQAAREVLWTLTIIPVNSLLDDTLTRFFRKVKKLASDERVETDYANVPELQEDVTEKITQLTSLTTIGYDPNDINQWLGLGLPEKKPKPEPVAPVTDPFANMDLEDNENEPQARAVKAVYKAPVYGSAEHKTLWQKKQSDLDEPVVEMQKKLKKFFQDQQSAVMRNLRKSKQYGRGKFKLTKAPEPEELFDKEAWEKEFKRRFRQDVIDAFSAAALRELTELVPSNAPGLTPSPAAIAAVKNILNTVANKTTDTTWNNLVDILAQAEADGLGIPAIQELLNDYFGGRKSDFETERIARTTVNGADNAGALEGYKESGVVEGQTWISALTDRTRETHAQAHGQTVGLDEEFEVGGESLKYPGDPDGDPSEIINCLCTTIPNVK